MAIHFCVSACLRHVAQTVVCIMLCHDAGNQTAYGSNPTSTANSATAWTGSITLPIGYYNITLEYHTGASGGTLIVYAGYAGQGYQVSQSRCALDMLQLLTCINTVQCYVNLLFNSASGVSAFAWCTICESVPDFDILRRS